MQILLLVVAPAVAALLLGFISSRRLARLSPAIPAAIFVVLLLSSQPMTPIHIAWIPSLDVSLSFFGDGLGLLFGLIISGIGTLVLLYTSAYFDHAADQVRFTAYTLLFMSAMLGIVFSANLLLIFVFWEITSITSYLLIGFKHEKGPAREGARRALLVTVIGGLAMMAGFLLIGITAGTFELEQILAQGDTLRESPLYSAMLLLVLAGAFTKSAQWPFHFWLPGAMEAPTPASAYLHSATMVKAGIFLIARLSPVLNGTPLWSTVITGVGLVTFLYGAVVALRHTDLKAILAYSTVSWLGILVALQGLGTEAATVALVVGLVGHAAYKGALFLVAGSVDHAAGTRDIRLLGGLGRVMPFTFAAALLAGLSMAGIPPLLGYLAKETLNAAALDGGAAGVFGALFPYIAVLGSAFTVAVALRLVWDLFLGPRLEEPPRRPNESKPLMWFGALILGVLSFGLPLLTATVFDPLVEHATIAIRQQPASVHLHLFEGINAPLLMSAAAIFLGVIIFLFRRPFGAWLQARREYNPVAIYEWLFNRAVPDGADKLTRSLQNGRLRYYMRIVVGTFVALTALTLLVGNIDVLRAEVTAAFDWRVAIVCALLMVGAVAGVFAPTRLSAIAVLGIEGALLSLLFALFGAPDLAFTQLMIEVITLVLFVLAFHFLPDAFVAVSKLRSRMIDAAIAASAGVILALLILGARSNPLGESISRWYIENAYGIGQGHNVVNVILVDFRGLDTQGEIVVLIIAAMGVTALLRLRPSGQHRGMYLNSADVDSDTEVEPVPETAKDATGEDSA